MKKEGSGKKIGVGGSERRKSVHFHRDTELPDKVRKNSSEKKLPPT